MQQISTASELHATAHTPSDFISAYLREDKPPPPRLSFPENSSPQQVGHAGILIGRIEEVQQALDILRDLGPEFNFAFKVSRTTVYWPSTNAPALQTVPESVPINIAQEAGLGILGAPLDSTKFTWTALADKLQEYRRTLAILNDIPDASIRFHPHRMTASTSEVSKSSASSRLPTPREQMGRSTPANAPHTAR